MQLQYGVFLIFRTSKIFDATYRTEYVSAWTYNFTAAEIVYQPPDLLVALEANLLHDADNSLLLSFFCYDITSFIFTNHVALLASICQLSGSHLLSGQAIFSFLFVL